MEGWREGGRGGKQGQGKRGEGRDIIDLNHNV